MSDDKPSGARPKPGSAFKKSGEKPSTARPQTGSAFKLPGNRKVVKASTPSGDRAAALDCDISAIPASTPWEDRRRKPSTSDVSTIGARAAASAPMTGRQAMPAIKKALYKPSGGRETSLQVSQSNSNKASKQMELDMAYNTYLLTVAHNIIQEKHYADTKAQIEADLGALSKRLAANQLNLETTKQRISKISFLSEQDRLLKVQHDALTNTLDQVEGDVVDKISAIGAALDEKADNLQMRNIVTGTADLKKILADSSQILSQLKASSLTDDSDSMLTATNHLRNTTETMRNVNARYQRVVKKLPEYQAAPIIEHAMKTLEAELKEQENLRQDEEEESSAISQP